jgi:IS30 family transposase
VSKRLGNRPIEVLKRLVPGDWESDLNKGKMTRSQVSTLVDRNPGEAFEFFCTRLAGETPMRILVKERL